MTIKPMTIEELLAKGGVAALPQAKQFTKEEMAALAVEADAIEARYTAEDEVRVPGRPKKHASAPETVVKGLRLKVSTWKKLNLLSIQFGSSVNRIIEDAVNVRLKYLSSISELPEIEVQDKWNYSGSNICYLAPRYVQPSTYEMADVG